MPERLSKKVVIVGAGISGLCTAYWLKKSGADVLVLEKDLAVGGTMRTIHDEEWLIETGPNSALETTPLLRQLVGELGIQAEYVYANEMANKRYILRAGMLHPLPMSPVAFMRTGLWSLPGKLRLMREPFIGRAKKEESIAEFVERRLGREFLDYAINPFVAGVFAGDPAQLSVQSAFPKLFALEKDYGSLIKGAIRSRKDRKARKEVAKDRARMFSFNDGMQTFPRALADSLGESIKVGITVEHVIPVRAGRFPRYTIYYKDRGERRSAEAEVVVLATPAHVAANIIRPIDPALAKTLESIYYPPVAGIFLGFPNKQITRELDGFGFLVPEIEHRNILGTIWSSSLFPHRAPAGHAALTTFVGGARQPELVSRTDDDLMHIVLEDLKWMMGVTGNPVYRNITRWEQAIPQYNVGYHNTVKAIEMFEANFRGAFICGNYRGGISVGDCVMSADKIVNRITQLA